MTETKPTEDAPLFTKTSADLVKLLLPARWAWHFATRRFGLLNMLGSNWNGDKEPMATQVADGILFGEGPRFRLKENALYFSDMYGKKVLKYELATKQVTTVYEDEEFVSGLGWLPDDRLLIVAMTSRRVLAHDQKTGKTEEYADIAAVTRYRANDAVMDVSGRLYVGNFGFDFTDSNATSTTTLVRIDPDQSVHVEATGMFFPNGSVITPDGKTLIVAETFACVLTAFDIAADGSLSNRRVWADIGLPPDGIALDAEGCVWVSVPHLGLHQTAGALLRVREGGEITNLFGFGMNGITNNVIACQLATDATTGANLLFFLEAASSQDRVVFKNGPEEAKKNSVLKVIEVPVGPARIPGNDRYCGGYC